MGDLLGSLTKPHTAVVRWLNWGQYQLEGDQGSPVEGFRPCHEEGRYRWYQSLYPAGSVPTRTSGPKGGGL